ncbi:MAG TPA: hypothetical protein VGD87_01435 [Archangium sp.]
MLSHHDNLTRPAAREDAARGAELLMVQTFLKPQFRIAVTPASGELKVQVELRPSDGRPGPLPRH